eukprot:1443722-Prymnesium_polylepis.1
MSSRTSQSVWPLSVHEGWSPDAVTARSATPCPHSSTSTTAAAAAQAVPDCAPPVKPCALRAATRPCRRLHRHRRLHHHRRLPQRRLPQRRPPQPRRPRWGRPLQRHSERRRHRLPRRAARTGGDGRSEANTFTATSRQPLGVVPVDAHRLMRRLSREARPNRSDTCVLLQCSTRTGRRATWAAHGDY